jgi:hypothetical protein
MELEAQALGSCQEGVPGSEDGAVRVPVQLQLLQGLPRCEQLNNRIGCCRPGDIIIAYN